MDIETRLAALEAEGRQRGEQAARDARRRRAGVLAGALLALLLGSGLRPANSAGSQAGGLPALAQRVAALEAQNQGQAQQIANLQSALSQEIAARQAGDLAQQNALTTLQNRLAQDEAALSSLDGRVLAVEAKTASISVVGSAFTITGKNVFIQDGTGATDSTSGLGNLTVGYNGLRGMGDVRTGTHNLILGDENNYSSFGGLVAGNANTISGRYATVTGGFVNVANAFGTSIAGGSFNQANGVQAAILGGSFNQANGANSTVSGGSQCVAAADVSSVSGGLGRTAPFLNNWAAGGLLQNN